MLTRKIALLIVLCANLNPAVTSADGSKPEAKKVFREGQVEYKLGLFEQALDKFTKAYKLYPHPGFLFNIGQCHRELEDCEQAIFFFEQYLREKQKSKNRVLVMDLLAECRRKLKEQEEENRRQEELERQREEARLRELERKKREMDNRLAEEKARRKLAEDAMTLMATMPQDTPPDTSESTPFYKTWWFWTIVSGAAAAVAGGTIYAVSSGDERTVLPSGELGTFDRRGL